MRLEIKNSQKEQSLYASRVIVMIAFACLLLLALVARLVHLQWVHYNQYSNLSSKNTQRVEAIAPTRGLIYDRNGQILAQNKTTYQLHITPEQVHDMGDLLAKISTIVNLSEDELKRFHKRLTMYPKFASIPLKVKLDENETAAISVYLHKLSGVSLSPGLIREYPHGAATAHFLGYVGRINESDLDKIDKGRYQGTYFIGKSGLERQFESILHGHPGSLIKHANAYGRPISTGNITPATPGKDLHLTIDLNLQKAAIQAMENKRGAIVAFSPKTGEIYALVSMPSFDPNIFVTGLDQQTMNALASKEKPLFNRFLHGKYPPASTLKPLSSLAGLYHRTITRRTVIDDPGWFQINERSRVMRDWLPSGHGKTDVIKAIRESCDTFYYYLGFHMGIDKLSSWLTAFGFGEQTHIDLPSESKGLVPTRQWKQSTIGAPWYQGETLVTIIGQGYFSATPLQLAQSMGLIANRGKMPFMHLVRGQVANQMIEIPFKIHDRDWQTVIEGMEHVVKHPAGTAYRVFKDTPYEVAGKTGTAQVFGWKGEKKAQHELPEHLRDHSLFIGYAPIKTPEIAVAVVLENQSGSADVAKSVLDSFMESHLHAS